MTTEARTSAIEEKNGLLIGPYREPRNNSLRVRGSIHDEATAQKLGFRGGTVAGSIHMEQFPPLMLRVFGPRWFETGGLSTYFRNATTDREPVRAYAQRPADGAKDTQIRVWMEKDDGMQVLEGTASIGTPSEPSMVRAKFAEPRESGEQRMLGHLTPGQTVAPRPFRLERRVADARLRVVTEPLDWYQENSPWGEPIVHPGLLVHMLVQVQDGIDLRRARAVGLYGAIEVQHHAGPACIEHDYEVSGKVLAIGQTPKTEYVWYESMLTEPGKSEPVASMLMMLRFMKASSPLWK